MSRRIAAPMALVALQLVALVLAHELVFLARYGSVYGEALVHAGHGGSWNAAVMASLGIAAGLAGVAAVRLMWLGLKVRRRGTGRAPIDGNLGWPLLLQAWLRTGPRIAAASVVLLTIQENLERAAIGQAAPGPLVLASPEYTAGLPITIAVGLAVGLVAALFEWRRRVLLARLRAARAALPRPTPAAVRPGIAVRPPADSLLGRRSALRAPPLAGVAT